ncbi:DUF4091 domain-containing protein [Aggregicoccus sp. 17bor-14]|uniref:DUF4091 domain-containing protein n=1 Tax=Myxococcaceae TaxID=31 RepID=UPI00129C7014|nr:MULTISPECIES: DUF4091 domain-containing protein [Myxococcaceae]MBF5044207.1 DUF4091 domain-containing protein [Simulacricoccus sp. 17bor-14]MRI89957.1 DUF4091 domain-containing protein [Aggregicoccus sp. 17bor-14]
MPSHIIKNSTVLLTLGASLLGLAASAAPTVYAESATVKVRPSTPARTQPSIALTAARNEFASFQVVVAGGSGGVSGVRARFAGLSGPSSIPAANLTLYREAYLDITSSSGAFGQKGLWPDALVPDVDEIAGEQRTAFPFDVPANESRAVWVDMLVPQGAAPGVYKGQVEITGSGYAAQVPVTLTVVNATLPTTSSLASAFLIYPGNVCKAHTGTSDCGSTRAQADLLARYQRMALEHRLTLTALNVVPQGGDWSAYDAEYGPFIEGRAQTRLSGAKLTSVQFSGSKTAARFADFQSHFKAKGWLSRAFDYTADEPPYGATWAEAKTRAQLVRSSAPELRTLITTNITDATANGLTPYIDVMTPVVNHLDGTEASFAGDQSAKYAPLRADARKSLWAYQSCMSQGCGYGTNSPENQVNSGWPSYMVDRSGAKNRAMQWVAYLEGASGELYYETALALPTAWTNIFQFNGNGDGTLFYPGTTARIGGKTEVPVSSIRLKLIRQGMQDYEWLKLVEGAGDAAFARSVARSVVPAAYRVGDDGAAFDTAHAQLVARYQVLAPNPPAPSTDPAPAGGGSSGSPGTSTEAPEALNADGTPVAAAGCSSTGSAGLPAAALALLALGALGRRRRQRALAPARRR